MVSGGRVGLHLLASALRILEIRQDDDGIDRLHYIYTAALLLMFAVLVSAKQYGGHPIECFVPAQFTHAMEQYTENYCWVQNTYWVPFKDYIPHRIDDREKRQIGYYQWIPFVMALAALLFHIPASFWRMLSPQTGINLSLILSLACSDSNVDPAVLKKNVDILARHIEEALDYQREYAARKLGHYYSFSIIRLSKSYGCQLTVLYLFIKCLHLTNLIAQFFFINKFLETSDYPLFGGHVLYDILMDQEWKDSGKFPRVTLCDFEIRALGNIHRHTVQCVLVINMFTEKIFVFLWLWFLILTTLTFINLFSWVTNVAFFNCRNSFIEKLLNIEYSVHEEQVEEFVNKFLRTDGTFVLRMVSMHAGELVCSKLTDALIKRHFKRRDSSIKENKFDDVCIGKNVNDDYMKQSSIMTNSQISNNNVKRSQFV
uniref:Innexin n=1 Tax=Strongyloides venezuelensis TaxID=75913 RepID=A0A0K0EWS6_STRVS